MGNQVAHSPHAAPPLLVRTGVTTHRLDSGQEYRIGRDPARGHRAESTRGCRGSTRCSGPTGRVWVLEDPGSRNGTFLGSEQIRRLEIRTNRTWCTSGTPEDGPVLRFELSFPGTAARQPRLRPCACRQPAPARISGGLVREPVQEQEAVSCASLPSVDRRPTARMPLPSKVMKIGRRPDNDIVVLRPRRLQAARRAAAVADRPVPDHRPGQPQRHVRQRLPGQPGRAERRRHHRDRPRHLPAGRRRADRVRRRRAGHLRGARAAGPVSRRRQARRCCSTGSPSRWPSGP